MTIIENRCPFFRGTTLRHWEFDVLENNMLSGKLEDPLPGDATSYNGSKIPQLHCSENLEPRRN
jgi:hypothetical protein